MIKLRTNQRRVIWIALAITVLLAIIDSHF